MTTRTCRKCGSHLVAVKWVEASLGERLIWPAAGDLETPLQAEPTATHEHLACTCERCGFKWTEKTLDNKDESDAADQR